MDSLEDDFLNNAYDLESNFMQASIQSRDEMLRWCYSKLHHISFSKQEDALMLDRIKLLLETGVDRG